MLSRCARFACATPKHGAGLLLGLTMLASPAFAQTVLNEGQVLTLSGPTTFSGLLMDGGMIRLSDANTGAAFTISATDATFQRGEIRSSYVQVGAHTLNLFGTTSINAIATPGLPEPADGMYLTGRSSEGSAFLLARNLGTVVQAGQAPLLLRSRVTFENTVASLYDIRADVGIRATDGHPDTVFINRPGATVWKTNGTGTSDIAVRFDQETAKVEAWVGQLWLSAGGTHRDSRFYADTFGSNQAGGIAFGGAHTFHGNTLTETGNFSMLGGGKIQLASGLWQQNAAFSVHQGSINIAPGARLFNSGTLQTAFTGTLTGSGDGSAAGGSSFRNTSSGIFSGSIGLTPGAPSGGINVINGGQFTVTSFDTVTVRDFSNHDGVLSVDGVLSTTDGSLRLLGGELRGSGQINGDVFVGGGPGTAVFNPGNSPGTMTIDGEFSLLPGGVLNLEIERAAGGLVFDRVIANSFFLNGRVNFLVGAGVTENDVIGLSLLDCGGCSVQYGSGFSFDFPGRPGSMLFADASGLHITALAPVPEPGMFAMLLAGLGLVGFAARRRNAA